MIHTHACLPRRPSRLQWQPASRRGAVVFFEYGHDVLLYITCVLLSSPLAFTPLTLGRFVPPVSRRPCLFLFSAGSSWPAGSCGTAWRWRGRLDAAGVRWPSFPPRLSPLPCPSFPTPLPAAMAAALVRRGFGPGLAHRDAYGKSLGPQGLRLRQAPATTRTAPSASPWNQGRIAATRPWNHAVTACSTTRSSTSACPIPADGTTMRSAPLLRTGGSA